MRAELVLAAVLLSGCSVVSMERVGGGYRREATPRCSVSAAPMVVDGIFAGVYGILGTTALAIGGEQDRGIGVVAAGTAVVTAASAAYGWVQRGRCRRAFAAHDEYLEFEALMRQPMGAPGAER